MWIDESSFEKHMQHGEACVVTVKQYTPKTTLIKLRIKYTKRYNYYITQRMKHTQGCQLSLRVWNGILL